MPKIPYRADVDGLRAVAVLSVIGFHAYPASAPGGFVGVDIFFVISGFLISSLILSALKEGSFSFTEFCARRVRRLFPALIVVLSATWLLGWFTLPPTEFAALGKHTAAGAAFAANIATFSEVGYFDAPAVTKPLLHLWSLGVEEQFYIIFPTFLVLLWRWTRVRSYLILMGIASFALNIGLVWNHPAFAFYLPVTRLWEFILGALLAWNRLEGREFNPPKHWPFATRWRDLCAATGLLLIAIAIGLTSDESFPG